MSPDALPPGVRRALTSRMREKFAPEPEPYLKRRISFFTKSAMPSSSTRLSSTVWMKHADPGGRS